MNAQTTADHIRFAPSHIAGGMPLRERVPIALTIHPETIAMDKLASYRAAVRDLGLSSRHRPGGIRENNRAENSHLAIRRRERKRQKFKSQSSAQRVLASHAAVYNTFNIQPQLVSRPGLPTLRARAHEGWTVATAAA